MIEEAKYLDIYEPIRLEGLYADASVKFIINSEEQKILKLLFKRVDSKFNCTSKTHFPNSYVPSEFDQNISLERIKQGLRWILDMDSGVRQRYNEGLLITVDIPFRNDRNRQTDTSSSLTYWKFCRSIGELIRPIFLVPPSFDHLFNFQIEGVEKLLSSESIILADDMGLGKTIETIMGLRFLFNNGIIRNAFILCPKSLLANWDYELSKWAPELSFARVTPSNKPNRDIVWDILFNKIHILLTNYDQIRSPAKKLLSHQFDIIIADEAHRIRKDSSQLSREVRRLKYRKFWALTGTPIERDVEDFVILLATINPQRFAASDKYLDPGVIRRRARPYIFRRRKEDVLKELPSSLIKHEILELYPEQMESYRNALHNFPEQVATSKNLLVLINKLRSICDYDEVTEKSSKIDRIIEILTEINANAEKAVIFSYLLNPLHVLKSRLHGMNIFLIDGNTPINLRMDTINAFQSHEGPAAFLASSRVGGEGITLTAANHVIFLNEWWNPSSNNQAKDRVLRIGQKNKVLIYKFICKGTIEESLQNILFKKAEVFTKIVDSLSENIYQYNLDTELLKELQGEILQQKKCLNTIPTVSTYNYV